MAELPGDCKLARPEPESTNANFSGSVTEVSWTLNLLTYTNSMRRDEERGERSVITMTLHWHSSQIYSLGNCVEDTPIETGLRRDIKRHISIWIMWLDSLYYYWLEDKVVF